MQDHYWYEPGKKAEDDAKPAKGSKAKAAQPKQPRFRIRMGSLIERSEFDAELDGRHSASSVPAFIMLDAAIEGVKELLESDDAAEVEELLRGYHSLSEDGERSELSSAETQQVAEVQDILSKNWPSYRHLVEQNARYRQLMPLLAFSRWVDGFENITGTDGKPVEYERDKTGAIPDGVLRRIHPMLLYAAGNRAYNFQYATGEVKN